MSKIHVFFKGRQVARDVRPDRHRQRSGTFVAPRASRPRRLRQALTGALGGVLGCVLLVVAIIASAAVADAAPSASGASLSVEQASSLSARFSASNTADAVQLDGPAVVRIITAVEGQVTCVGCATDGSNIVFPQSNSSSYPAYTEGFSGSGAFISPDGYILTADHVVDMSPNTNPEIFQIFVDDAIADFAQETGVTQAQATQIFQQLQSHVQVQTQVAFQSVFLSTLYTGQLSSVSQVISYPITRIVESSPVDNDDVAIVKVQAQDMPFITLASASSVNVQDAITAVAFPGDADTGNFGDLINPSATQLDEVTSLLTPTVETGSVISQKTQSDGTPVYETTGISSFGSSGGPVIDTSGQIVGFVDAFNSNNNGSDERVTDLVPSSVAEQYASQSGIRNPVQGQFETEWTKALAAYDAGGGCNFAKAATDLARVHTDYPQFGGVQPYLSDAQNKANANACSTTNYGLVAAAGGGGLLVLVVIVVILLVVVGQRKRANRAALAGVGTTGVNIGESTGVPSGTLAPPIPPYQQYPVQAGPPSTPLVGSTAGPSYPGAQYPGVLAGQQPSNGYPSSTGMYAPVVVQAPPARVCVNGHAVTDPNSAYCSQCGAPVQSVQQPL